MMEKIQVKLCLGTTCFVMGASKLQELDEIVAKKYADSVEVSSCVCLNLCSTEGKYSKAPYAKVDDEVVAEATVDKVLEVINRKLKHE